MSVKSTSWNVIIVTTGNQQWREALQQECDILSAGDFLPPHEHLLVVDDPQCPEDASGQVLCGAITTGVGSGGATINALLVAAETLSARRGRSMINSDDLKSARILLVHFGRPSPQQWLLHPATEGLVYGSSGYFSAATSTSNMAINSACDALSTAVPTAVRQRLPWPATPLLTAVWNADLLATNFTTGVWISSVECSLMFPSDYVPPAASGDAGVVVFTVPVPVQEALNHGLVLSDNKGHVAEIVYKPSKEQCARSAVEGLCPVLGGQAWLSSPCASRLLFLYEMPPLASCTYHATDAGQRPFSVSLYFELMAALCSGVTRDEFVGDDEDEQVLAGENSHLLSVPAPTTASSSIKYASIHYPQQVELNRRLRKLARESAWEMLSPFVMSSVFLPSVIFHHPHSHSSLVVSPLYKTLEQRQAKNGRVHVSNCVIKGDVCTSLTSFKFKGKPTCLSDVFVGEGVTLRVGGGSVVLGLTFRREEEDTCCDADIGTSFSSHLEVDLGGGLVWQQSTVSVGNCTNTDKHNVTKSTCYRDVVTCHGITDNMILEYPKGGMFNRCWDEVLRWVGRTADQVWVDGVPRTPLNARLFTPRFSVKEQVQRLLGLRCSIFKGGVGTDHNHCSLRQEQGLQELAESRLFSLSEVSQLYNPVLFLKHRHRLLKESILLQLDPKRRMAADQAGSVSSKKITDTRNDLIDFKERIIDVRRPITYLSFATHEFLEEVFDTLHRFAAEEARVTHELRWSSVPRLLAVAADVLSALAGWRGNMRAGPAANSAFTEAFHHLQNGRVLEGVAALETTYHRMCDRRGCGSGTEPLAVTLTRAARHYERAAHLLIAWQILESVQTIAEPLRLSPSCVPVSLGAPPPVGVWVEGRCPARLDLAGGWSDTPPICYELGGAVLNVAVKVNGEKPITIRGRWMDRQPNGVSTDSTRTTSGGGGIACLLRNIRARGNVGIGSTSKRTKLDDERGCRDCRGEGSDDSTDQVLQLLWTTLDDFKDYNNPMSPGALVKAALVYCGIVDIDSRDSLGQQLAKISFTSPEADGNVWLELEMVSRLPSGSGLGGSSLVASALLAVLADMTGRSAVINTSTLIHAVLALEQVLTTGGGWQDQIGGIFGGVKLGVSHGELPVRIQCTGVPVSLQFLEALNERLVLVFTGQVRLAKNLVQGVIRSWYTGDVGLHSTFRDLIRCALDAAAVLVTDEDDGELDVVPAIDALARCINTYWNLKKTVAPGCEPLIVTELLRSLEGYLAGASLAGAGGGGYMYALQGRGASTAVDCREANVVDSCVLGEALQRHGLVPDVVEVDETGLVVTRGSEVVVQLKDPEHVLGRKELREIRSRLLFD